MRRAVRSSAFQLLSDFDSRGGQRRPDRETEVKSSYEDGYLKGLADARTEAEAECQSLQKASEEVLQNTLASERDAWQRDCADILKSQHEEAIAHVQRRLGDRVASLLKPWLSERLHERVMFQFEKAIERALGEGAKLHIEGPADLLASLRDRFPVELLQVSFAETSASTVRAHLDDTQLEINISAWISDLEGGSA